MERVVDVLTQREALTGEEFQTVLEGGELPPYEEPVRRAPRREEERPTTVVVRPSRA